MPEMTTSRAVTPEPIASPWALVHVLVLSAAVTVTVASWVLFDLGGWAYYRAPLEVRGYMPAHQWLRPAGRIAQMLGLPGKLGMDGSQVWDAYQAGKLAEIRDYCETDVLNTYLIFLRFELIRGNLDQKSHELELQRVRDYLKAENKPHFQAFLDAWK